jgi:hypothetical protein
LKFVDYLLNVWDRCSYALGFGAPLLGSDLTGQSHDSVLYAALYIFIEMILDQHRIEILADAVVEVGVDLFGGAGTFGRDHRDLIGNYLGACQWFRKRLGLSLVRFVPHLPAESDNAFVAILTHGDVF